MGFRKWGLPFGSGEGDEAKTVAAYGRVLHEEVARLRAVFLDEDFTAPDKTGLTEEELDFDALIRSEHSAELHMDALIELVKAGVLEKNLAYAYWNDDVVFDVFKQETKWHALGR